MSKRLSRPWDKADRVIRSKISTTANVKVLPNSNNTKNDRHSNTAKALPARDVHHPELHNDNDLQRKEGEDIPFVTINNTKYYSDRFYLNRTVYDNDDFDVNKTNDFNHCHCGAKQAPPLFDRAQLIASLDLQAVIFGTFSFEMDYLQKAFPSLFGSNATVPTLVMHGKKGWTIDQVTTVKERTNENYSTDDESESEPLWSPPRNPNRQTVAQRCEMAKSEMAHKNMDQEEDVEEENRLLLTQEEQEGGNIDDDSILTQEQHYIHSHAIERDTKDMISTLTENKDNCNLEIKRNNPYQMMNPENIDCTKESSVTTDSTFYSKRKSNKDNKIQMQRTKTKRRVLPSTVYFSEIRPVWVQSAPVSCATIATNTNNNGAMYRQGVHHPKFMILLEKSGSMVIAVSTSNFTRPTTTDATWLQRFYPKVHGKGQHFSGSVVDGSDFGVVLANFLHCESVATQSGQMTALQFVQRFCQWESLKELQRRYDYSQSQVHLISVVPGDYVGHYHYLRQKTHTKLANHHGSTGKEDPHFKKKNKKQEKEFRLIIYGRQRVAHILEKICTGPDPLIPPALLHEKDRLIIQPTSLGAEWNQQNMAQVMRSYMTAHSTAATHEKNHHALTPRGFVHYSIFADQCLLEKLDIVWPTEEFVQRAKKMKTCKKHNRISPKGVHEYFCENESMQYLSPCQTEKDSYNEKNIQVIQLERENEGYLFLSSETFNSIDLSCLSQMVMYEPSYPMQQRVPLVPHFKSICRIFEGNDYRLRKDFLINMKCEEYFPWFLLTSACLSRGAQGEDTIGRLPDSDSVSYSNFELGVLFCSRLRNRSAGSCYANRNDRLYCWKPSQCSCKQTANHATNQNPRIIHLPIPYCLRPSRYQGNAEEAGFCETPYFHEIIPGTGCIGHMHLTPYGSSVSDAYEKAGL